MLRSLITRIANAHLLAADKQAELIDEFWACDEEMDSDTLAWCVDRIDELTDKLMVG